MGKYNFLYLDENILPIRYRNVYAISLNGSSAISIYSNYSSDQNIAVFIIPDTNCNQHSFFAMSKNIFRIGITSKSLDYNLHTCGFSPSFITNVDRKVSFGYKSEINAKAQIFYGFNSKLQTVSLKKLNSTSTKQNNHQNFFNGESKSDNFFNETGFLVSDSVNSEIKTLNNVNTSYYVLYEINQTNTKAKIAFNREFDSKKEDSKVDNSMLASHFDFLLYYDKYKKDFIYDDDWASSLDISYSRSMWESMKWAWISIILIFAIIFLIVIICVFCRLKFYSSCCLCSSSCCCCSCCCMSEREQEQDENHHDFNSELNEDYAQTSYHYIGNLNRNVNYFESVRSPPNLDEEADIVYPDGGNVIEVSESSSLQHESDRKSHELDAKKKNRKTSVSMSPYQNDESSLYSESDGNNDKRKEVPNPYGLPPVNINDKKNNENGDLC